MTVTLRNTTRSDLGVGFGILVPARGEATCSMDKWKAAQNSRAVQGWLNAGKLIAEGDTPLREVREFRDPAPDDTATEAVSDPQTEESAAGSDDTPETLFDRAVALGLSPSPRWKPDTLRRKIAEAENS